MIKALIASFSTLSIATIFILGATSCANIIPPGGGPIDSLPPVLLSAVPKDSATHFTGNKIVLTFDEYVEVADAFQNVVVSPLPDNMPVINTNFKTITIKIRDTLKPNTTYAINFGNAIKDINEGNIYRDFTYAFSTGDSLATKTVSGRVMMAETGKIDSTLIVVLHSDLSDSSVAKNKPQYMAKLDGKGNFKFNYLPEVAFAVYVIPNDYSKHYEDTTKPFAFADKPVNTATNEPITLYAYKLSKKDTADAKKNYDTEEDSDSKNTYLQMQPNLEMGRLDILSNLELTFSKKVASFDSTKIMLTDTLYKPVKDYRLIPDTGNRFIISHKWTPAMHYQLLIDSTAFSDSSGMHFPKNDTIKFVTKKLEEYGSVRLRFNNLDTSKNPVLQIVQNDKVIDASPLKQRDWFRKLYRPGEYDLRILYDRNKNGVWDPGNFFGAHIQPEKVVPLDTKVAVRANWDNEKEITLMNAP